jgi:hypothetical protein
MSLTRHILISAGLSLASLSAGAAVLIVAEFGAPSWIFVALLTWLVTFGLPTLVSVLLLARFWPGPSFLAFVVTAVLLSVVFHFAAIAAIRRIRAARRRRRPV